MKKSTLIAAAVAAAISGSAFAADTTMYGNIRLGVENMAETDLNSNKLVVGFKASEDMGNGMTGFMHLELEHDDADYERTGWSNDQSYVGVKGDFGQIALGSQYDAAGFACGGTDLYFQNGAAACGNGSFNGTIDNAITYVKGFGDVTVVLGVTLDGTGTEAGVQPANGDHTIIAAQYAADAIQVGFQLTSPDSDLGLEDQLVVGGTYTINDIVIGLTFSDGTGFAAGDTETATAIGVQAPLAGGTLLASYDTGDSINDETNIAFHKDMSKSVYTGVELTMWEDEMAGEDTFLGVYLGMKF